MKLCKLLRDNQIGADFVYARNPKLGKQLTQAAEQGIPLAVIFGQDEIDKGMVKIRRFFYEAREAEHPEKEEIEVLSSALRL